MTMVKNIQLEKPVDPPARSPTAIWLASRGLRPPPSGRWRVTILLDIADPWGSAPEIDLNTRLHISIQATEWGVFFCRGSGSSWIRVKGPPRVHERDDFGLLPHLTDLRGLGGFVSWLERRFEIQFRRPQAVVYTNLPDAQHKILLWIVAAL
ncbi:MAG TPA: hypothetical protein VFK02_19940 [Kofleriaceae bacterium]|nr:hypothetical protein [Kofleriaceae bacterium]